MSVEASTIRLLGVAVLFVFFASLASEQLFTSTAGTGGISSMMENIASNAATVRASSLVALLNSLGIVALACLFYSVFREQYRLLALIALGLWLAEAVVLALSKIGSYALIPLSQEFVAAGAPEASHFQPLGRVLYFGFDRRGYDLHMAFFCLGGMLWYYLLFASRAIPAPLSLRGFISVGLLGILTLAGLYGDSLKPLLVLGLLYEPYELVLGIRLVFKGFG